MDLKAGRIGKGRKRGVYDTCLKHKKWSRTCEIIMSILEATFCLVDIISYERTWSDSSSVRKTRD